MPPPTAWAAIVRSGGAISADDAARCRGTCGSAENGQHTYPGRMESIAAADFGEIRFEVSDHIATIELHRPDHLNAGTGRMVAELCSAFDLTDADDDVRAVIVTGHGTRAFCAGADLSGGADGGSPFTNFSAEPGSAGVDGADHVERDGAGLVTMRMFASVKPVIGAINGAAVGMGATMTLPMDVRLASTTARFGFVFSRRGVIPEGASSWFLPRIVGISRALEWCYSGRLIAADEALAGGLVRSLHEPDELLPAARQLAVELAQDSAPVSVSLTRQMMWRMLGATHPMDAHRVDSRGIASRAASADAIEGVASFLEKRSPVFTDRVSTDLPDIFPDWTEPEFS